MGAQEVSILYLNLHYEEGPENVKRNLQVKTDISLRYYILYRLIMSFLFGPAQSTSRVPANFSDERHGNVS